MKKNKKIILIISICILVIATILACNVTKKESSKLRQIKNEKEYQDLLEFNTIEKMSMPSDRIAKILTLPASLLGNGHRTNSFSKMEMNHEMADEAAGETVDMEVLPDDSDAGDFSTTNVQVENIDEADSIKTDGKYIYTLNNNVINVIDVKNAKDSSYLNMISFKLGEYPEDLFITDKEIIVIGQKEKEGYINSFVKMLDKEKVIKDKKGFIKDEEEFKKYVNKNTYEFKGKYNTSRILGSRLVLVIDDNIEKSKPITFEMQGKSIEAIYKNIIVDPTRINYNITQIASINLDDQKDINLYVAATGAESVYVSNKNIYLISSYYGKSGNMLEKQVPGKILSMFGPCGLLGLDINNDYDRNVQRTKILKLELAKNNEIKMKATCDMEGASLNQFSFDEKDDMLRIALSKSDNNGSSVAILNDKLTVISEIDEIAKGERIYAARFVGDRLYLVTYRNMDPLWVIDLSDANNIKLLGELELSGYSTYLHPYDESHLIGIGIETEEYPMRDDFGRITSTMMKTKGLKLALFDVTDVKNPKLKSSAVLGNEKTTSSILRNHKALLFSKQKGILAIPIQDEVDTKELKDTSDEFKSENIDDIIYSYNLRLNNVATRNGYAIFDIDKTNGIRRKGNIYHEVLQNRWHSQINPVRGVYIKNNLYTISNNFVKINDIKSLGEIKSFEMQVKK